MLQYLYSKCDLVHLGLLGFWSFLAYASYVLVRDHAKDNINREMTSRQRKVKFKSAGYNRASFFDQRLRRLKIFKTKFMLSVKSNNYLNFFMIIKVSKPISLKMGHFEFNHFAIRSLQIMSRSETSLRTISSRRQFFFVTYFRSDPYTNWSISRWHISPSETIPKWCIARRTLSWINLSKWLYFVFTN